MHWFSLCFVSLCPLCLCGSFSWAAEPIRVGVIGLDTSHAPAFVKLLNDPNAPPELAGFRVVAAYPQGSKDIQSSVRRVPEYTKQVSAMGVEIVGSIDELLNRVDAVLLESNDGRPHAEQVLPVLKAGKPVFVDKPVAGSLADVIRIYEAAERFHVPVFSSSSLRYTKNAQALRNGKVGKVLGAEAYSPCELERNHPDLFWYGVHGVETLYTVMGTGCQSVVRASTPNTDVVVGTWAGGRIGVFRGMRTKGMGYGGTVFGEKGIDQIGPSEHYGPLVVQIAQFFRSRTAPVDPKETLEIYTFMEAADESKHRGGVPVPLREVYDRAVTEAHKNPLR
ncbi:MAG TPA: Gfo/Idh/MocA family oxidoreductase [Gemmataceae bacterium]|nr:Gfo/Idh/MocA family oxidoreductase [Gemmataceae bacterium]